MNSNYQTYRLNIYQYQSDYAAYTEELIDKVAAQEAEEEAKRLAEEEEKR